MSKIKIYDCKDCIVLDAIIKHSIKILSVSTKRKNGIKKWYKKMEITSNLMQTKSLFLENISMQRHPRTPF